MPCVYNADALEFDIYLIFHLSLSIFDHPGQWSNQRNFKMITCDLTVAVLIEKKIARCKSHHDTDVKYKRYL